MFQVNPHRMRILLNSSSSLFRRGFAVGQKPFQNASRSKTLVSGKYGSGLTSMVLDFHQISVQALSRVLSLLEEISNPSSLLLLSYPNIYLFFLDPSSDRNQDFERYQIQETIDLYFLVYLSHLDCPHCHRLRRKFIHFVL